MVSARNVFRSIGYFFSLEALDTRLGAPRDLKRKQQIVSSATPSRWGTLEFKVYLAVFAVVVPLMWKAAMDSSNETNPNYWIYKGILSDGWIFGRKVDNTDSQYRFFRDNFFLLFALLAAHCTLRRLVTLATHASRTTFDLCFGSVFLFAMHGFNCVRILFHVTVVFLLGRLANKYRRTSVALMWVYGVGTLFLNDRYRLVKFGDLVGPLSFMDSFKGIVERWDVFFNFTLLRMLSFNLDYVSRLKAVQDHNTTTTSTTTIGMSHSDGSKAKVSDESAIPLNEFLEQGSTSDPIPDAFQEMLVNDRKRMEAAFPLADYSYANYFSYLFYAPLFIAGPILTFNDYLFQSRHTLPSINWKRTGIYGLRFLFCILMMELILHYIYVVAVSKAHAWYNDTPFQISMIGLFNLNIIWLKLLIPWRLFRLWALCDGIDPAENMIRCVDNNYSALQFWRAWHRSYNKWVIRYIYVPLGGSHHRILASLAVFSFVAIWHDIELRLLIWGWLVVFFLLPEIILTKTTAKWSEKPWYRHLCSVGAVVNIWLMMFANLYGFCLGNDGMKDLLSTMFTTANGGVFFVFACGALFVGTQVMFELRETEKRRGVYVKC